MPAMILEVITKGVFKGCDLSVVAPTRNVENPTVYPFCQCVTKPRTKPGSSTLRVDGGCHVIFWKHKFCNLNGELLENAGHQEA